MKPPRRTTSIAGINPEISQWRFLLNSHRSRLYLLGQMHESVESALQSATRDDPPPDEILLFLLRQKFHPGEHFRLAQKLEATNDRPILTPDNPGLGPALMQVRKENRELPDALTGFSFIN